MFSSYECAIKWAHEILKIPSCTYLPASATAADKSKQDAYCIVSRVSGQLDYPHDFPEFAFQLWAKSEEKAEELANILAIASKTMPPEDSHVLAAHTPNVFSYGKEQGGWFIWQVNISFSVSLRD